MATTNRKQPRPTERATRPSKPRAHPFRGAAAVAPSPQCREQQAPKWPTSMKAQVERLQNWARRALVVALPLLGLALIAARYKDNWYFYDEWSMIHRVLATRNKILQGITLPYNGHLYIICYLVYKAQLALGLANHALVWSIFCASLLAVNVAVAMVLWAGGVPPLASTVAGAVIAYFGPGAQLMTFEFQFTMNAAIALPILSGYFVLRDRNRSLSSVLVAVFLLLAIIFDSATAFAGLIFVAVLVALRWRDRWMLVALGPAVVAGATLLLATHGALLTQPATPRQEALFAAKLLLLALGGLVGAGKAAGIVVLVASASALAWALHKHALSATTAYLVTAGFVSGLAMVTVTAWSRAGLVKNDFFDFNRYISLVAVYLLVALAPLFVAVARTILAHRAWSIEPVLACMLVVVFLLNLQPLARYRSTIETWMTQTHALVEDVTWSMSKSCPSGESLDPAAQPLGTLDPQITVGLLRELEASGSLEPPARRPALPPVVTRTAWRSAASAVCARNAH